MPQATAIETVLKRDRIVVLAGLAAVTLLAWTYLARMAMDMGDMPMTVDEAVAMTRIQTWSTADFILMFLMWVVMMIGMMVPSAAPVVLIFAASNRKRHEQGRPFVPTAVFLAGYLIVWTAFSLLAATLQWALDRAALLSPMMVTTSPRLGGLLLAAAGVFQLTPIKKACLRHCHSPLDFIMRHWRAGAGGALRMGLEHGAYCLGCCWVLMTLLFFGGVMNLLWIAMITIFVLIEKVAPFGPAIGRAAGAVLILAGLFVVLHG